MAANIFLSAKFIIFPLTFSDPGDSLLTSFRCFYPLKPIMALRPRTADLISRHPRPADMEGRPLTWVLDGVLLATVRSWVWCVCFASRLV